MTSSSPSAAKQDRWEAALAGALSGSFAAVLLQPLDVIKTRQQQPLTKFYRARLILSDLLKTQGTPGLFRGTVPAVLRVAPGAGFYFWALQKCQENYKLVASYSCGLFDSNADAPSAAYNATSSALCRASAVVMLCPLLVIKTRVESSMDEAAGQQSSRGRTFRAASFTLRNEGVRGFFTGSVPSLCRDVPFAAAYYASYVSILEFFGYESPLRVTEQSAQQQTSSYAQHQQKLQQQKLQQEKQQQQKLQQEKQQQQFNSGVDSFSEHDDMKAGPIGVEVLQAANPAPTEESISPLLNFFVAATAGIVASILTHPFDVLRTQMQLWEYQPSGCEVVPIQSAAEKSLPTISHRISGVPLVGEGGKQVHIEGAVAVPTCHSKPRTIHIPDAPASTHTRPVPRGAVFVHPADRRKLNPGIINFTYNLVKIEGYSVFWRGLMLRLLKKTLSTALAWTAFEELNQRFIKGWTSSEVP